MDVNPSTPIPDTSPEPCTNRTWYGFAVDYIFKPIFWITIVIFGVGLITTYAPGAEVGHYRWCAALFVPGLLIPAWRYRIPSAILVIVCLALAQNGVERKIEYDRDMREHRGEFETLD